MTQFRRSGIRLFRGNRNDALHQVARDGFLKAMTYQSDSFARRIGLNPAHLPCLIVVEDVDGDEFWRLPAQEFDDNLFQILRYIVGEYAIVNADYISGTKQNWSRIQSIIPIPHDSAAYCMRFGQGAR